METVVTDYQKRNFDFTGKSSDGKKVFGSLPNMTIFRAKYEARTILKNLNGGHIDIWDSDGAFVCDVEV